MAESKFRLGLDVSVYLLTCPPCRFQPVSLHKIEIVENLCDECMFTVLSEHHIILMLTKVLKCTDIFVYFSDFTLSSQSQRTNRKLLQSS